MAGTFLQLGIGITVDRSENLPGDMTTDDVATEVRDVVQKALDAWYAERGHQLLRCEPVI